MKRLENGLKMVHRFHAPSRPLLALSPVLLLLVGCPASGPGQQPDDQTGSPVPEALRGNWQTILTYVPAYYTGVVALDDFGGSLGAFFYFYPDGQYQFDLNTALTYFNGNCFAQPRGRKPAR